MKNASKPNENPLYRSEGGKDTSPIWKFRAWFSVAGNLDEVERGNDIRPIWGTYDVIPGNFSLWEAVTNIPDTTENPLGPSRHALIVAWL